MPIKIVGNRVSHNDLHVWILVSDITKEWLDIPFTIDTPIFDSLPKLKAHIDKNKALIATLIQGKLEEGVELKQSGDICVDKPELITDDTVKKVLEKETLIKKKQRDMAIGKLEKEGKL